MTKSHAIGMSKKNAFKVDPTKAGGSLNTITVYADVAVGTVIKYAYLSSNSHFWEQPTNNPPTVAANTVTITAYCLRRRPEQSAMRVMSGGNDDGDLTVTLVYDDGAHEECDECVFELVEYDH